MGKIIFFMTTLLVFFILYKIKLKKEQQQFIKEYKLPQSTLLKFRDLYPNLSGKEEQLVIEGLKQYFFVYSNGNKKILMPSRVVDDLWHCFLRDYYNYNIFCKKAFGKILNHYPLSTFKEVIPLSNMQKFPNQLLKTFTECQKVENNSKENNVNPLLFIIDLQLNINNGFYYTPEIIMLIKQQIEQSKSKKYDLDFDSNNDNGGGSCSSCGGGD